MNQRKWHKLGKRLRSLRRTRDLKQQAVVNSSGEDLDVRTLRAYEKGEFRPSRKRLLNLLIKSLDLNDTAEINDCLRLAEYVALGPSDLAQYGLALSRAESHIPRGRPADFRIEVRTLIVIDGQGREVWYHEFESELESGTYDLQRKRKCAFGDIDGDGGVETLFVVVPDDFGAVGTTLLCFAEDGKIKWQFEPGKTIRDTQQEYRPPYFISNVRILPILKSPPRILVSSNHYMHNPNQLAVLDPNGKLISEYWHSGHLLHIANADINGDGIQEVLLGGVNNGYGQATLLIFDPRNIRGASRQPGRQVLGFPAGTETAVVLFSKTCVSQNSPYNRVAGLHVTRENRIVLALAEGVSEARNPGVMIYELDFQLHVVSAKPDSHLQEAHRLMEVQGVLDHSWTEQENERLRRAVIVRRRS